MIPEVLEKGKLLIAEPTIIGDLSFNRSVVLLAEYNEKGAVGFILNKPLEYTLKDLLPEISSNLKVFNGGPVEQDNLYFIHCVPDLIPESIEISNGIYWGGDFNTLIKLLNKKVLQENDIQFFLGYSGWSENQLQEELQLKSWIVTNNDLNSNLIGKVSASYWKEKMVALGGDYLLWSNAPENPNYN